MMNCQAYEEQISAFLDGELSGPEQAELMEHMAACQSCRQYFDDLTAIHEAAVDFEEVPVPEGFARQVMDRVRTTKQDKPPKVIRFTWRRRAALAACCAFVLFGAWRLQTMREVDFHADREMTAADEMPQMAGAAGVPEAMEEGAAGTMAVTDGEQPVGEVLSRMADSVSEMYEAEENDAVAGEDDAEWEAVLDEFVLNGYVRDSAKDAPAPSPAAPAEAMAGGTLIAGGDIVRQWVENELGLDWESGQMYALTGEQYAGLVDFLTEAGVAFRVEAGDACRLMAE